MTPEKNGPGTPPRAPTRSKTSWQVSSTAQHHGQARRLPPYSKPLADARARGLVPRRLGLGHVCVALHWDQTASAGLPRIVCPPDQDPASFRWDFLAGLVVHVQYRHEDAHRVPALVDAMLAAGVARVEAVDRDGLERGEPLERCWPRFEQGGLRDAA